MAKLTYDKDHFLLDGEPFTIISGTIHYFRVFPEYWEDRLKKLKACGFNTVETYTCWNLHERKEGQFDFSGILDIARFIRTAQELGLYVILRPGPYICAELEFGGLPSWLLKYDGIKLRCNDAFYLSKVERYYKALFDQVRPFFAGNGGSILMTQIENEYGSYGDDKDYLRAIAKIYEDNGVSTMYFTSDGPTYFMLGGGTLPEYLATANFGSDGKRKLEFLKAFRPDQPVMCCEFWNGWFDHWYEEHHVREGDDTAKTFAEMLDCGGSVNFYMFHGGTNFGFTNGANYSGVYQPTVTSYDYDAPLSEAGDMTPKYFEVKAVIEERFGKVPEMDVHNSKKAAYGKVALTGMAPLLDNLDALSVPVKAAAPLTMEELGQDFGFIHYSSVIEGPCEKLPLIIDGVHDRAQIFLDGKLSGIINRCKPDEKPDLQIELGMEDSVRVDILVENMGRVNYGKKIPGERKGITRGVSLGQRAHFGWEMRSITCDDLSGLNWQPAETMEGSVFYKGSFTVGEAADTWVRLDGFKKGIVLVNGFNLGRYWNEAGPQKTLYVPAPLLKEGENEIIVLEVDGTSALEVTLTDTPDLG
ncbi:MAG: beta-galactosidase [Oscillospiraceae bacterium]|nr:beta-galactosidase [Oscillospiraceae bacterium]